MNVNIAGRGHSNMAVTAYLINPKRDDPVRAERLGNHETFNLPTNDLETAAKVMAWTDQNREHLQRENGGIPRNVPATAGNVYHWSLSWHPDAKPSWEHMRETVLSAVEARGLAGHQFYIAEHTDEPHKHVHIVTNLVDPETGKINNCWKDRDKLDRWANDYELGLLSLDKTAKEYTGLQGVECVNRAQKYEDWENGVEAWPRPEKKDHSAVVTDAFATSDTGQAFQAALADQGLVLARGKRRVFVVVDGQGAVQNLTKLIEFEDGIKGRAKTAAIRERLADIAPDDLPDADAVAIEQERRMRKETESGDGDEGGASVGAPTKPKEAQQEEMKAPADDGQVVAEDDAKKRFLAEQLRRKSDAKARQPKETAKAARKQADKEAAERLEKARAKQEKKWEEWRRDLSSKTDKSREKWQIEALTKDKEDAEKRVRELSGLWSKVFKPFQRRRAQDKLKDVSLCLDERTERFAADVSALKAKEPSRALPAEAIPAREPEPERVRAQVKPKPEPGELSSEQRKAAVKEEYLDRQARLKEERGRRPSRDCDLDRE